MSEKFFTVRVVRGGGRPRWVTAATFTEGGEVRAVTFVGVSGGAHGYLPARAEALRKWLVATGEDVSLDLVP